MGVNTTVRIIAKINDMPVLKIDWLNRNRLFIFDVGNKDEIIGFINFLNGKFDSVQGYIDIEMTGTFIVSSNSIEFSAEASESYEIALRKTDAFDLVFDTKDCDKLTYITDYSYMFFMLLCTGNWKNSNAINRFLEDFTIFIIENSSRPINKEKLYFFFTDYNYPS